MSFGGKERFAEGAAAKAIQRSVKVENSGPPVTSSNFHTHRAREREREQERERAREREKERASESERLRQRRNKRHLAF